jgi:alpha-tubulin suppressor-like RCC1 family protein
MTVSVEGQAKSAPPGSAPFPVALSAGSSTTCELRSDDIVTCWGRNQWGEAGDPSLGGPVNVKTKVQGLAGPVKAIAVGDAHSCALLFSGNVQCWGFNGNGELGNPQNFGTAAPNPIPLDVTGLAGPALAIAAGLGHTCALVMGAGPIVQCWGNNWNWQLGNSVVAATHTPLLVAGISDATAITAGWDFSCALGAPQPSTGPAVALAHCWGENDSGELGTGIFSPKELPGLPVQQYQFLTIIAGSTAESVCGTVANGTLRCWGRNEVFGLLGNGMFVDDAVPLSPQGSFQPQFYSASADNRCLVAGGAVFCWGSNEFGQLANGNKGGFPVSTPQSTAIQSGASAIAVAPFHACAIVSKKTKCWGRNDEGQLGDGSFNPSSLPVNTSY